MSKAEPYHVMDGYSFVAYPNRDSVPFRDFYKIPEAQTVIRGSLRYKGNPGFIQALANLGWLEQDKKDWLKEGMTWAEIQQRLLGSSGTDEACVYLPSSQDWQANTYVVPSSRASKKLQSSQVMRRVSASSRA